MAKFSISLPDALTAQLDTHSDRQSSGRSKVIQDALSVYFKNPSTHTGENRGGAGKGDENLRKTVQAQQSQLELLDQSTSSLREALIEVAKFCGATLPRVLLDSATSDSDVKTVAEKAPEEQAPEVRPQPKAEEPPQRRPVGRPPGRPVGRPPGRKAESAPEKSEPNPSEPRSAERGRPRHTESVAPSRVAAEKRTGDKDHSEAAPKEPSRWHIAPKTKPKR